MLTLRTGDATPTRRTTDAMEQHFDSVLTGGLDRFRSEVLEGLAESPKRVPPKYFYDELGSQLFDRITELDEYYLPRIENAIMETNIESMMRCVGRRVVLIEYGSGSSVKTRMLLSALHPQSVYVPIDISKEHLSRTAAELREAFPDVRILPVHADYSDPVDLPPLEGRRVIFFPGSTIGNLLPQRAVEFLRRMRRVAGDAGGALLGIDLKKESSVLVAAYDDARGATARFNLNVLRRMNRELDADFDLTAFSHRAVYNGDEGRVEMHLVSRRSQTVHISGHPIHFEEGEYVHTENSYKYTVDEFRRMALRAGLEIERVWTDPRQWFAILYLRSSGISSTVES